MKSRCLLQVLLATVTAALVVRPADIPLVGHGEEWHYHKGTNSTQADWRTVPSEGLDATWLIAPGGFGFGDAIATEATLLTDMSGRYTTLFLRREFLAPEGANTNLHLQLVVDFDDGFVAYLNGLELARSNAPGPAGSIVAYTTNATATREASCCDSPNPPVVLDLGPVGARLLSGTNVLALQGLNQSAASSDFHIIADLSLVEIIVPTNAWGGTLTTDTTWTAAASPYYITSNLTVPAGVTLTIEPGVVVRINTGVGLSVSGRLLAEGNATNRIRFLRASAAGAWSRLNFSGGANESRLAWCEVDGAGGSGNVTATDTRIRLSHVVFTNTLVQLVNLDNTSCVIEYCSFPSIQADELLHFFRMPPDGYALIASNFFGTPGLPATTGYNDIIDFTGGNRPGPIVEVIGNTFLAAVDDGFDMDGTDAHIEGNVFLNVLQDAQRDTSSSPITTGEDNFGANDTSQLVICRNVFYNCEHMLLLKDGGSAVVQNNTIVRLVSNPLARTAAGAPIPPGVILFGEPWRGDPPGAGAVFEGNIVYNVDPLVLADPFPLFDPVSSYLVVNQNLLAGIPWPGEGNLDADPLFVEPTGITHENFRSNLALSSSSPARGTGPNGLDMGALVPAGASISGEPGGTTTNTTALLTVAGPGIFAYKWRLDDGPWSGEVPLTTNILFRADMFAQAPAIALTSLAPGTHTVEVLGRNSAGTWQASASRSRMWTVAPAAPFRITKIEWTGGEVVLEFPASAGVTYSVQYSDGLGPEDLWQRLRDVSAGTSDAAVRITDAPPPASTSRYYRLVTPAQP